MDYEVSFCKGIRYFTGLRVCEYAGGGEGREERRRGGEGEEEKRRGEPKNKNKKTEIRRKC